MACPATAGVDAAERSCHNRGPVGTLRAMRGRPRTPSAIPPAGGVVSSVYRGNGARPATPAARRAPPALPCRASPCPALPGSMPCPAPPRQAKPCLATPCLGPCVEPLGIGEMARAPQLSPLDVRPLPCPAPPCQAQPSHALPRSLPCPAGPCPATPCHGPCENPLRNHPRSLPRNGRTAHPSADDNRRARSGCRRSPPTGGC